MNDKIVLLIERYKEQIERQRALLKSVATERRVEPYGRFMEASKVNPKAGVRAVGDNKIGALLLAGGVGSRLGFNKPKGCFPIAGEKTLYQCAVEKIKASGKRQLAVMTSEATDFETRVFFEEHSFFGLSRSQVDFFCQESWPFLDQEGELFLSGPEELARGPNGNGEVLSLFAQSSIFQKWQAMEIEQISLFPVDNPLADPFYLPFIAHHLEKQAELSLMVTRKRSSEEKMGGIGRIGGRMVVIEYGEIPSSQKEEFLYGNTGMLLFTMEFAEKVKKSLLPMHVVKKTTKKYLQLEGNSLFTEIAAYKFEQFIFDLLDYSDRSEALICDREMLFAPLKEAKGPDGVASVQKALLKKKTL